MALDANTPHERVEQLIALTQRLAELMRREADAFEAHRPHDVVASADETARLANLYRHESLRLRRDPGLIEAADAKARQRLMEATRAFDEALHRHGRAVEACKVVTEGLVKAIAEEVAAQKAQPAGYGARGVAPVAQSEAITLNRRA